MNLIILILVILVLFGGGGYYGHVNSWGGGFGGPGIGLLGILLIVWLVMRSGL